MGEELLFPECGHALSIVLSEPHFGPSITHAWMGKLRLRKEKGLAYSQKG